MKKSHYVLRNGKRALDRAGEMLSSRGSLRTRRCPPLKSISEGGDVLGCCARYAIGTVKHGGYVNSCIIPVISMLYLIYR